MRNYKNKALVLTTQLALAALLTACGGDYRETSLLRPQVLSNSNCVGSTCTTSGTGVIGVTSATGVITPTPTTGTINPSVTYDFSLTGAGGNNPTWQMPGPALQTDTTLKVRVTAGPAGQVSPIAGTTTQYSNWTHNYYCVNYTVEVSGIATRKTGVLSVSGGGNMCPSAPASKVLDFSGNLYAGHPDIRVNITGASYSLYCEWLMNGLIVPYYPYTWNQLFNQYCSEAMYPVYKVHTVTGTLEVEVGSDAI